MVKDNDHEVNECLAFEFDTVELDVAEDGGGRKVRDFPFLVLNEDLTGRGPDPLSLLKVNTTATTPSPTKRSRAAAWLVEYLATAGPMFAVDIYEAAKHFGVSSRTLRRAAGKLGIIKTPPAGGAACVWSLSPAMCVSLDPPIDPQVVDDDLVEELKRVRALDPSASDDDG
ncbi:hypothetical protein [Capillimicrobium parvum]|uniref:Uncharacterized protein n=1 Tax=Capillimicrobium parvum TaxID=2884022 RepID=A0A9E6XTD8_9ACTN|nr:hypothetical protein [Capillimicrobium parvum]UGS34235.1 hypothetical protein DSM104329_00608 [Capillimicrobium parvum]